MIDFEAEWDNWLLEHAELFDEEKESKAEYYEDLCRRADYYGMESLTEEEQYLLLHRPLVD